MCLQLRSVTSHWFRAGMGKLRPQQCGSIGLGKGALQPHFRLAAPSVFVASKCIIRISTPI